MPALANRAGMRYFLKIDPGHCVECRDAHQAELLARVLVALRTGEPVNWLPFQSGRRRPRQRDSRSRSGRRWLVGSVGDSGGKK